MAQLMPLPLTVSCFSKIHIGFTFLVPVYPGSKCGKGGLLVPAYRVVPDQRPLNGRCCCCCLCFSTFRLTGECLLLLCWIYFFPCQAKALAWGNVSEMTRLCRVGRKTTTESSSRVICCFCVNVRIARPTALLIVA